ncbi:PspC domain-containing protein [Candidatus Saccharibacteria bacterium]|nr:PspC domain-containing protein [Candidatus Saccharibacteria bacterium]
MNEVTRIHLGRMTYEIDVEAKKELEKYIAAIKRSLGDAEIMDDIESRMTEILADRGVERDGVITSGDVAAMRAQLGEPRDFADDDQPSSDSEDWHDNLFTRGRDDHSGRKYYRDTDNAMLGGVAAGLSAYTGWDLTLLRIAFVVAGVLSVGWALLIYIVVWIVAPAARTTSEKLEMRGEPVTLESLKNSDFAKRSEENARAFADDVKEKVAGVKAKAKQSKDNIKSEAKTYAAEVKAELREEIREQNPTRPVSPIAAIFGVILTCLGFITLAGTFIYGIVAIVILFENSFAKEVWLWLATGAAIIAGLTTVGLFMSAGQALMNRRKRGRVASEIAGTLGATIMFGFISSIFMGVWLWTIPRDYQLPDNFINNVQRFDDDVCSVKISWPRSIEILRQCD